MFRSIALASILALGTAGAAFAQDSGPVMTGGGDNLQISYPQGSQNVVGGGNGTITGGGENQQVSYAAGSTVQQAPDRVAVMTGGGDNMQIVYVPVAPGGSMLARAGTRSPNG